MNIALRPRITADLTGLVTGAAVPVYLTAGSRRRPAVTPR
jgi:hypothetical protein